MIRTYTKMTMLVTCLVVACPLVAQAEGNATEVAVIRATLNYEPAHVSGELEYFGAKRPGVRYIGDLSSDESRPVDIFKVSRISISDEAVAIGVTNTLQDSDLEQGKGRVHFLRRKDSKAYS